MEKNFDSNIMNYAEFINAVKRSAESVAGEGGSVSITHVIKNNGCEYDGLVILRKGYSMSPTIYLNGYYEQYCNGKDFDSIFEGIKELYMNNKDRLSIDTERFKSFEGIKDRIAFRLVNYNANQKLLSLVPHKRILDLAMIFYCIIEKTHDSNATALIYNANMHHWNVSEEEIYTAAINNSPKLLPPRMIEMSQLIQAYDDGNSITINEEQVDNCHLYVLTNDNRINGAACMLYENVLKDFADKINSNLYILPSSIHEVIILPEYAMFSKNELVKMVREVNSEGVSKDEILSYKVYEYDRVTGELSM